eukprot:scaffold772_cov339-Pavlova_lutheri.AAC.37
MTSTQDPVCGRSRFDTWSCACCACCACCVEEGKREVGLRARACSFQGALIRVAGAVREEKTRRACGLPEVSSPSW